MARKPADQAVLAPQPHSLADFSLKKKNDFFFFIFLTLDFSSLRPEKNLSLSLSTDLSHTWNWDTKRKHFVVVCRKSKRIFYFGSWIIIVYLKIRTELALYILNLQISVEIIDVDTTFDFEPLFLR